MFLMQKGCLLISDLDRDRAFSAAFWRGIAHEGLFHLLHPTLWCVSAGWWLVGLGKCEWGTLLGKV